jgi:hypothetical protein
MCTPRDTVAPTYDANRAGRTGRRVAAWRISTDAGEFAVMPGGCGGLTHLVCEDVPWIFVRAKAAPGWCHSRAVLLRLKNSVRYTSTSS